MKTGIIGLGLRAANVLKMLIEDLPELDLVGYVDPDPCGLSILDDVSHNLIRFESLDEMIEKCYQGSMFSRVDKIDVRQGEIKNFKHFEIIRL